MRRIVPSSTASAQIAMALGSLSSRFVHSPHTLHSLCTSKTYLLSTVAQDHYGDGPPKWSSFRLTSCQTNSNIGILIARTHTMTDPSGQNPASSVLQNLQTIDRFNGPQLKVGSSRLTKIGGEGGRDSAEGSLCTLVSSKKLPKAPPFWGPYPLRKTQARSIAFPLTASRFAAASVAWWYGGWVVFHVPRLQIQIQANPSQLRVT